MSHHSYAIEIKPVGVSAALIHAISRQQMSPRSEVNSDVHAGSPYPQSVTINAQKTEATATTMDIANALDLIGVEGAALEDPGIRFWQIERDPLTGMAKTTDVHRSAQMKRGKVVPMRLSCEHQGDASLELKALGTKDPSTDDSAANLPIVFADSLALPTGLGGDERYTLHEGTIGGTTVDCLTSVSLDFGIGIATEGCNSNVWDGSIVVNQIKPILTFTGRNIALLSTIGLVGTTGAHANTGFTLRRRSQVAAGFTALTGTEHIRFTINPLAHWETITDSSNNNSNTNTLQLVGRHDGTNTPLIVQTGVALSV
ncbi:hypothetical protein [Roseiconus lacunae]|uniref:Phage tail protein n=1 Tax=Roseiconus lacunae TaxID=2605694 RepID=A0ABT7PH88_9BACT|nr:hypothetical protein [Roseiconus lacunae]MDM4015857.1 hypothetical protein [Roseiconus lacunae]